MNKIFLEKYNKYEDDLLEQSKYTIEGRSDLADYIGDELKKYLSKKSIYRNLFLKQFVDENGFFDIEEDLKGGFVVSWTDNNFYKNRKISHRDLNNDVHSSDCQFSNFIIFPTIDQKDFITKKTFDKFMKKLCLDFTKIENESAVSLIDYVIDSNSDHKLVLTYEEEKFSENSLLRLSSLIEKENLETSFFMMNENSLFKIINLNIQDIQLNLKVNEHNTGFVGKLFGCPIFICNDIKNCEIYALASKDNIGYFFIEQDIFVIPSDNVKEEKIGFSVFNSISPCIFNSISSAKLVFKD